MLNRTATDKLICLLARGDSDGAVRYLNFFRPEDRAPPAVRALLESATHPEVMPMLMGVAPWLAGDELPTFGRPKLSAPDRIRALLQEAGEVGAQRSAIRRALGPEGLQALDELVEAGDVTLERERTGGRKAARYRLAEFSEGIAVAQPHNPFA